MKKSLLIIMAAAFAGMATFFGGGASAGQYPAAPPGTYVTLPLSSFIQSVPYTSWTGSPDPNNPVLGDNLNQHPGAFYTGQPSVGASFIGVFGGPIDTRNPDAKVYLWEATSAGFRGESGPQIQLGYWDGTEFIAQGNPRAASYWDTGVSADIGGVLMEINSSATPLTDFGISPGSPQLLNAVEIEAADINAHNQVIAVAVIPEPSAMLLLGAGLACFLGYERQRKRKRLKK